jgi:hypothetical protein
MDPQFCLYTTPRSVRNRTLSALLGPRAIRLIDGLRCPHCESTIANYPEETDTGWRLICRNCHGDLLVVDEAAS